MDIRTAYISARRAFRIARRNPMDVAGYCAAVDVYRAIVGRWDIPGRPAGFLDNFEFRNRRQILRGPYTGFARVFSERI